MKMKVFALAALFTLLTLQVLAQEATLTGVVTDESGVSPVKNVVVSVQEADVSTVTDLNGNFKLSGLPQGELTLIFESEEFERTRKKVNATGGTTDIGTVTLKTLEDINQIGAEDIIPTVTLSETDLQSDGAQSVSGLLTASRDIFINTAAFTFGSYRFRIRGYDSDNTDVYFNGLSMADLETGRSYWSQWGGLNDVTRGRENTVGLSPVFFTFGGVGGATNIDARASNQWKQLRVAYSASNRSYNHRIMATYNSGVLPGGWAVSLSGSRRWAKEGYVDGTFYDAWSYFGSVEKIWDKNTTSLTVFGAPIRRGKQSPSVQEAMDLAGTNYYNSYWGYQEGEKRNSRVFQAHLPTFILNNEWKPNDHSRLFAAVGYQFGNNSSTALNWYNAPDPRPDYYRNLPSYIEDPALQAQAEQRFLDNPDLLQLDWENLYNVNYNSVETVENYNNTGRDTTLNLAKYFIEDRHFDRKRVNSSLIYENSIADWVTIQVGAQYNWQRTFNYVEIEDLLGAATFVNVNQFAERDFPDDPDASQFDVDNPNQLVGEGDRYSHDYNITVMKSRGFAQAQFSLDRFDFFASAHLTHTTFWRTGNNRNGLFPDNSKGDSEKKNFINYGVKGGVTYKVTGRNYLVANAAYLTRAPYARNAFISPRTRNDIVNGLKSETIYSFEGGYLLKAPKVKARAMFYFSQFLDGNDTYSFYYDLERNFVNIALTNIDKRHLGGEFAVEAEVLPGFKISGVAALGQYIYNSRQEATITLDNNAEVLEEDLTIYSNNFFLDGTPQMAGTIGLNYRSPNYWFASLNFSYFDRIWIDFNPIRRTNTAVDLVDPDSDLWNDIINQQQVDGQFTMDLFAGASWKLDKTFPGMKNSYYLYFTLGINNLLNNKDFITGGFEQTRLDFENRDTEAFPPNYFYAYGTNFFFNVTFRM